MRYTVYFLVFVGTVLLGQLACTLEEEFVTDPALMLRFSQDTIRFDTVFTEVGSATRSFKVYNPRDQEVNVSSIRVANDAGGKFRINVDGRVGPEVENIFLPPNDSIYVFVEVTVDPDQDLSVSPFVFTGQVLVTATEVEQPVQLEAFGQNANYLPSDRTRANFGVLTCNLGEIAFDDPRPYVLYGSLIVDECTLVLPAGTRLYIHGGLVQNADLFPESPIFNDGLLIFQNSGRLRIDGTLEEPVLIATDRLEEEFLELGGQYSGIRFGAATGPHRISHATIRNGIVGVFVDSTARVSIDHTTIAYTSSAALVGYQARVTASNLLCHSNGGGALQAIKGGQYDIDYATLVNRSGQTPAVALSNGFDLGGNRFIGAPLTANLRNCIVAGTLNDELALIDFELGDALDYNLTNCLLQSQRVPQQVADFESRCSECLLIDRSDTLFVNVQQDSFQLDTLSVAEGLAVPVSGITDDLRGVARDAQRPDVGAYEYQPN